MIDSTIVRAHQHSAGAQKKTANTRRSAQQRRAEHKDSCACRCVGQSAGLHPDAGPSHDLEGADALLPDMTAETLLADKAFDADERVIEPLLARGKSFVIPPKSNRKVQRDFDKDAYKARHPHREFLLQAQAIPRHRHSLRQNRQKFFSPQSTSRLLSSGSIEDRS